MERNERRTAWLGLLALFNLSLPAAGAVVEVPRVALGASASLSSAGAAAGLAVTNIFVQPPAAWTAAVSPYVSDVKDGPNMTPAVQLLKAKGYSLGLDEERGVSLRLQGRPVDPALARNDVRRAQVDSRALVARVARELVGHAEREDLSASGRVDVDARLRLLSKARFGDSLGDRERDAVQTAVYDLSRDHRFDREKVKRRMEQITAALGRAPQEDADVSPAPAPADVSAPSPAGAAPADRRWLQWDRDYVELGGAATREHGGVYLQADAHGDIYTDFLKKAGAVYGPYTELPPLGKVVAYYNDAMEELLREGAVTRDEVLTPVRLFRDGDGRLITVRYGEAIPEHAASDEKNLLSVREFIGLIAGGEFPLGDPGSFTVRGLKHSVASHDLGHLAAFLRHPRYMATFRKGAARIASAPGFSKYGDENDPRLFMFSEMLIALPPEERGRFASRLPSTARKILPTADVDGMTEVLGSLGQRELEALRRMLYESYPRMIRHYGGAMADIATREHDNPGFPTTLFDFRDALSPRRGTMKKDALAKALARFIVAAYQSSRLSPDDWMDAILETKSGHESPVRRFVCGYGIWGGRGNSDDESLLYGFCEKPGPFAVE